MSAMLFALGVGTAYLMNKKMSLNGHLDDAISKFQNNVAVSPATDGVTSAEVRQAHRKTDHVTDEHLNEKIPPEERRAIHAQEAHYQAEARAFDKAQEQGISPILGVMMTNDHHGI